MNCSCGQPSEYRVTKSGIRQPSYCRDFCLDCLKKDRWDVINWRDYDVKRIPVQTEKLHTQRYIHNFRHSTYYNTDTNNNNSLTQQ